MRIIVRPGATLALLVILSLLFPSDKSILAQNLQTGISGRLLYRRELTTGEQQIVVLSADAKHTFDVTEDECFALSREDDYIAISTQEKPETLTAFRMTDGIQILNVPWRDGWTLPCAFGWTDGNTSLSIWIEDTLLPDRFQGRFAILDVRSGEVASIQTQIQIRDCDNTWWDPSDPHAATADPSCQTIEAQLPNLAQDDDHVYRRSPNPDVFLYQRSLNGELNLVLYDIAQQETLEVLKATPRILRNSNAENVISWSPSGRYLVYLSTSYPLTGGDLSLTIYDVEARQYIYQTTIGPAKPLPPTPDLVWSPDEQYLTFVLTPPNYSDNCLYYSLVIVDRVNQIFRVADGLFRDENYCFYNSVRWWWSPDSRAIAFTQPIGAPRVPGRIQLNTTTASIKPTQLIYFDIVTEESRVLDDQVDYILDWVVEG